MPSRSRSAPCFCGSGRAFKQCCLRSLRQVRTIVEADRDCRWRIWRAYGPLPRRVVGREAGEHVCGGEFVWIGRVPMVGVSWLIDSCVVTLMDVLEQVSPEVAEWVVEHTLSVVGPSLDGDLAAGELDGLTEEFAQLARVAGLVADRLERTPWLLGRGRPRPPGAEPGRAAA